MTGTNLAAAKAQLENNVLPELEQSGLKPGPLKDTTVAGRPAFSSQLVVGPQSGSGLPMRTQMYWVFAEQTEYQITEQAPPQHWNPEQSAFAGMMKSLTLPGTWASGSPSESTSTSPPHP